MRAKELIKLLEQNGWHKISQKGSHLKMMRDNQIEIIPVHNRRHSYWYSKCHFKKSWAKVARSKYFRGDFMKKNSLNVYPAIFTYDNKEKKYLVDFIDLKGCSTFGNTLPEVFAMAQDAMGLYLDELTKFPTPTTDFSNIKLKNNQFINYVEIDMEDYRKKYNNKSIKKTLSIPCWLNTLCEKNNINFSQVLQEALKEKLEII